MKTYRAVSTRLVSLALLLIAMRPAHAQFTFVNIGHTNDSNSGYALAYDVVVSGNYAYLANHFDGLRIYDVSNPANPLNVGHTSIGGYADGVVVAGNYAYLSGNSFGLRVIDVSDPANPVVAGHTNLTTDTFEGIAIVSNYVYLAYNYGGLYVCDVSNPTNPIVVAHTNSNLPYTYGMAVSSNHAYLVGNYYQGSNTVHLRSFEVSNPSKLAGVGSITNGVGIEKIAVSGKYAYVAKGSDGFRVYDVSDSANPVDVGHTNYLGSASGLTVAGNFALLTASSFLYMYDVSNPAKLAVVGSATAPGWGVVTVSGDYVYVANGYDGLRVYLIVPQLQFSLTSSNTVFLSWPVPPAPGFTLQQSFDLGTTNWLNVTNSPTLVSDRDQVVLPKSGDKAFYRLQYQ
jgi:hypothetical protein